MNSTAQQIEFSDNMQEQIRDLQQQLAAANERMEAAEAKLATLRPHLEDVVTGLDDYAISRGEAAKQIRQALTQIEQPQTRERRVESWVVTRIGETHMQSSERAIRLLEESIELAQAEGITAEQVAKQSEHVYSRPVGTPRQEAAGVAVCLLGWCAANQTTFEALADEEISRIEAKPIDQIRGSVARKNDADLVVAVQQPQTAPAGYTWKTLYTSIEESGYYANLIRDIDGADLGTVVRVRPEEWCVYDKEGVFLAQQKSFEEAKATAEQALAQIEQPPKKKDKRPPDYELRTEPQT